MPPAVCPARLVPVILLSALLSACGDAVPPGGADVGMADAPLSAMGAAEPPSPLDSATAAAPMPVSGVIGRGFAQVAGQPGHTLGERRLMAIRAARLEAMRDLAEQVQGAALSSDTLLRDAVVVDDRLRAEVDTVLRGARTVSIQPKGEDGYEVVLQLDVAGLAMVHRILRAGS